MKVLIIEDEGLAASRLERLLKETGQGVEVVGRLGSVEESVNWLSRNPVPDLIFMDVQLEDGICFEIFENLEIRTPVIFTTAYDEYALRAFKVNSVDYLLKPLDREELDAALEKFRNLHGREREAAGMKMLAGSFGPAKKERFLIRIGEHYRSVRVDDIMYFYVLERCVFLYVGPGKNYPLDYSLDRIEELVDRKIFFRVNRNFLVNIHAIRDIIAYSSGRLKLVVEHPPDEGDILVSRERVGDFKRWMDR